jgi:phenylacetic acid degradation operon negative regulatory protein
MWDLGGWADRAHALRDAMAGLSPDRAEALAPGFELSAAVLRHLQADPLLPDDLLPDGWPGLGLRDDYDRWDTEYRSTLQEWSRA